MSLTPFEKLQQKCDQKAHLNPKWCGEACTFAPLNFPSRTVHGNCEVTTIEESSSDGQDLVMVDELSLHCSRDPNQDSGGIDVFRVGDQLYRDPKHDPDQVPFAATGEKRSANALSWTLVFTRRTVKGRSFDE